MDVDGSTELCPSGCPWHHTWPPSRFFSLHIYDATTASWGDVALPLEGASVIPVHVSLRTFKVQLSLVCARMSFVCFCGYYSPRAWHPFAASVVTGKASQSDVKSHVHKHTRCCSLTSALCWLPEPRPGLCVAVRLFYSSVSLLCVPGETPSTHLLLPLCDLLDSIDQPVKA